MSQALTARYRPQTFAQVAGQETIKTILSRAALEDKVAPAYLLSGTRGVGKTTIARIFAKALNCRTAPTAEPCCVCDRCRATTGGSSVDVVEIDGASNRGIDDVRRLKEDVGYAPMNGRYKIFIIDEAHMLSREAFNALLKTLEEPPRHVTFIMATTEPHKFPSTIISRCQHFVFKPLPEAALTTHLEGILQQEGLSYEATAVRLLARRGAGSVRDSMSLLGQALALGETELTEAGVRSVLGLAGQEAFAALLDAVQTADTPAAVALLRALLDQGLDMGFFLRELAQLWRNLFILRQAGGAGLAVIDLPEEEARTLLDQAERFSLTQLHASWQMTLDAGRRILTSLEPALGLELLVLNLCVLPQLLSLEQLSAIGRRTMPKGPAPSAPAEKKTPEFVSQDRQERSAPSISPSPPSPTTPSPSASAPVEADKRRPEPVASSPHISEATKPAPPVTNAAPDPAPTITDRPDEPPVPDFDPDDPAYAEAPASGDDSEPIFPRWEDLVAHAVERDAPGWFTAVARAVEAENKPGGILLTPRDGFTAERLNEPVVRNLITATAQSLYGRDIFVEVGPPPRIATLNREELRKEVDEHPLVRTAKAVLGADVLDFGR
jgi:DNA polymerase-3 subunit gamma/tau